ncbi:MAG: 2-oxo acid dehydrogenase subunit E2 [Ignavibacteriales bacterium]|nr:2-oxo acid dehydrogenase subunit E2 [Ignavibacteriales bacterium]MCF8315723.1 2-oxo acid dehydrogenase subunit E2 [Ignavibacteriales bacterium]MCF8437083.1 2-oxo acid dehydrogenase subunit E2 [Ignavibacteriales bacterium]
MTTYRTQKFPKSRIATIDVCEIGRQKHHVTGLIELDVSRSRKKVRDYNRQSPDKISFNAWIISVISQTIKKYETSAAYLKGKSRLVIFEDINVSMIVEKEINGQKVPIPLVIERANAVSIEEITQQISDARNKKLTENDIVLQKKSTKLEELYYYLPGFIRRYFWRFLLRHPKLTFSKMGNVAVTSIGMMGQIRGWFIPISIHPICFGIGSIIKKPIVAEDKIEIAEMLSMSILLDHDVMDGANMARFISELSKNIENGLNL